MRTTLAHRILYASMTVVFRVEASEKSGRARTARQHLRHPNGRLTGFEEYADPNRLGSSRSCARQANLAPSTPLPPP